MDMYIGENLGDAGADGDFPSHPYTKDFAEGRFGTGVSRNNERCHEIGECSSSIGR